MQNQTDIKPLRLGHRTVRVLRAVADCPGASNREIARRAGIVDQGQISKIMRRLCEQELICSRPRERREPGNPNSWWLTPRGKERLAALPE